MACAECDQDGIDEGKYELEQCIGGMVYGPCDYEYCGGACEPEGHCPCWCHRVQEIQGNWKVDK